MKDSFKSETITALILVVILILTLLPSEKLLMPMGLEMTVSVLLIIAYLLYSAVFWKENSQDERENLHRLNAGRISFLVGSSMLTLGVFIQSISGNIDPWLIYTLIAMVFAKTASRIYDSKNK